jgi:UDP-N-acetylmuramyl pentapeptide phosphotransferase/UDP-N-acetylglucosamine-1-phosphate transferase
VFGRRAVFDVANQRSSHTRPTVRGGGIGLVGGKLVALAITHTDFVGATAIGIFIAGLGFGAIGLADDLTGVLSGSICFWLQLVIAAGVIAIVWEHIPHGILRRAEQALVVTPLLMPSSTPQSGTIRAMLLFASPRHLLIADISVEPLCPDVTGSVELSRNPMGQTVSIATLAAISEAAGAGIWAAHR